VRGPLRQSPCAPPLRRTYRKAIDKRLKRAAKPLRYVFNRRRVGFFIDGNDDRIFHHLRGDRTLFPAQKRHLADHRPRPRQRGNDRTITLLPEQPYFSRFHDEHLVSRVAFDKQE
jgi:hypothetical protein